MGKNTNIEWATHTFNPWYGCTKVGPGCDHCYAEGWAKRCGMVQWGPNAERRRTSERHWKLPIKWNREAQIQHDAWNRFKKTNAGLTDEQLVSQGFSTPERPRVFCASLGDVFDNAVPNTWRWDLFRTIDATPHLDWLLLTKRIGNARDMLNSAASAVANDFVGRASWDREPWPNVWIGATICNQEEADRDIPKLLDVPAEKRFLSIEPMLGPVYLSEVACLPCPKAADGLMMDPSTGGYDCCKECGWTGVSNEWGIDWVIAGGESGPKARPMHPDWPRSLRDQCAAANVPFLFKQWGEWEVASVANGHHDCNMTRNGAIWLDHDGTTASPSSLGLSGNAYAMLKVGKKKAGRMLDGSFWDESPS